MSTENMVEVRGLTKTYHSDGKEIHAVKGIDLEIKKGEILSLLGPNGAGKTTTISMISGLIAPTVGDAKIGGHSILTDALDAKRLLGVIPQEIALYLELSARQNLEFFGKMYNLRGKELATRVDEVLDFIDLKDRQHDKVDSFSGGMKRRVNIGVGLLHRPQLIYMDEPTVGIDPQNRRRILDTVIRLRDEYGMTVLYTTHLMEEAQELSDRVGIIDHGEIIALGSVGDLTLQVGEEDRLVFSVGHQKVEESILRRFESDVDGVTSANYDTADLEETNGLITVRAKRGRKALPDIIRVANDANIDILSVEVREPDLEAVFLHLTGRALRD
jgi:ABC-2 type transport system ATP-binding protein